MGWSLAATEQTNSSHSWLTSHGTITELWMHIMRILCSQIINTEPCIGSDNCLKPPARPQIVSWAKAILLLRGTIGRPKIKKKSYDKDSHWLASCLILYRSTTQKKRSTTKSYAYKTLNFVNAESYIGYFLKLGWMTSRYFTTGRWLMLCGCLYDNNNLDNLHANLKMIAYKIMMVRPLDAETTWLVLNRHRDSLQWIRTSVAIVIISVLLPMGW